MVRREVSESGDTGAEVLSVARRGDADMKIPQTCIGVHHRGKVPEMM